MKRRHWSALSLAGSAIGIVYAAYRRDMNAAQRRISTNKQTIVTPQGPIEFAEEGNGPAVLMIHGAGGGFDQGLFVARGFLGDGYRVIAPSRFGYLGTPIPADASAEAQADAHVRVLDALRIERVPVIGISAGAPSAMQFCLRHPHRCAALILVVPLAYSPDAPEVAERGRFFEVAVGAIASSDFLFWLSTKVARPMLVQSLLGTPVKEYREASAEQRRVADEMLKLILPISRRAAGIANEGKVASKLDRYPLEDIDTPTLVISATDCLYRTYPSALYTAEHIRNSRFVGFSNGGHLLLGHEDEVRVQVSSFVREHVSAEERAPVMV